MPRSIDSDRDKVFLSHFWTEMFRLQGTTLSRSTAYHPQSDGQTEVVNRCLETYLRCFSYEKPRSWHSWLAWAEYWYNTTFHASTKMTPFKAVYGRDPPPLFRFGVQSTTVASLEQQLHERDVILEELKEHLSRAQAKMKLAVDGHRRDVQFEEGDLVYIKLRPYRLRSLARKLNEKLSPRYFGPFRVITRIGPVAYRLELPSSTLIHPVFHVSQLKKALGDNEYSQPLPPFLDAALEWLVEPESVLGIRTTALGTEVLIQWKGLPAFEATWESTDVIQKQFPAFHLEDKVILAPRGNDRPPIRMVYSRRNKREGMERSSGV